ncbi:MAG: hypothetical protein PHF11_03830 [Candidatus Omnitrophica bacterium]|nr:hypothetical protein [Candidatus Omnitrophota bacterium]
MSSSKTSLSLFLILFLILPALIFAADESITVTTYYPSPYGVYREMRAQRMAVGTNYVQGGTYCWPGGSSCTYTIPDAASLVVEGNVGIGTSTPQAALSVETPSGGEFFRASRAGVAENFRITGPAGGGYPITFQVWNGTTLYNTISLPTQTAYGAGNVGIGTTSPIGKLQVAGAPAGNNIGGGIIGGTNYSLSLQGNQNCSASAFILQNAYTTQGDCSGTTQYFKWVTSHGSFGSRGLGFSYGGSGNGITFYADSVASTANTAFTPTARMIIQNDGNVGIGTTGPTEKLHIAGAIKLTTNPTPTFDGQSAVFYNESGVGASIAGQNFKLRVNSGGTPIEAVYVQGSSGNVGISTTNPRYKLDVIGDIRATGSVYYGGTSGGLDGTAYTKPDYVFSPGYNVMTIDAVEAYLLNKNHLPWMTPLKDEKQGSIDMTRMSFETVETTENLQLQVIQLNKKLKEQESRVHNQEKEIEYLKAEIAGLKGKA